MRPFSLEKEVSPHNALGQRHVFLMQISHEGERKKKVKTRGS